MNAVRICLILCGVLAALLSGCASNAPAPVVELAPPTPAVTAPAPLAPGMYVVKKGDTLYSIALDHGQSYQDVAAWNHLDNPSVIKIGQQLRVTPPEGVAVVKPVAAPAVMEARPTGGNTETYKREPKGGKEPWSEQAAAKPETVAPAAVKPAEAAVASAEPTWVWPASGKVIAGFVEGGNKGVDIGGKIGDPVVAAEGGKVTYANNAIRGYGNLLIIQHPGGMTSVYAHNNKLLAKEGQTVARGQKVAEIGNTDTDQPKLHFEIRHQGKPLDPLKYLPPR